LKAALIDFGNGGCSSLKTPTPFDYLANLLDRCSKDRESLGLAVDEPANPVSGRQALAVGATAVRQATDTFPLQKRGRRHFAHRPETANQSAAQTDVGIRIGGHIRTVCVATNRTDFLATGAAGKTAKSKSRSGRPPQSSDARNVSSPHLVSCSFDTPASAARAHTCQLRLNITREFQRPKMGSPDRYDLAEFGQKL
jgi:hypothetical protein